MTSAPVTLASDCIVTLIPSGQHSTLRAGETVTITQALGGTVTVLSASGQLARLSTHDAAALGLVGHPSEPKSALEGDFDYEQVIEQLKTVFDPEIPVNIVDLGLVYRCDASPQPDGGYRIEIEMSMTAPGCGMGDVLAYDVRSRVLAVPYVSEVDVEVVWDPPWDQSRLSDAARLELGFY
jgi:probable FeS assembly SUF system protein SufT